MSTISEFLQEIDELWMPTEQTPIDLHIIGSTALFLKTDYIRETKDSDVLHLADLTPASVKFFKEVAGKGTKLAKKHGMFLDMVPEHVPFLPTQPEYVLCAKQVSLKNFRLFLLDNHDVAVSKLLPYRTQDREDIVWLADNQLLSPAVLLSRFKLALLALDQNKAHCAAGCIENLHEVEREIFRVPESEIKLPSWLKYV